MQPQIKHHIEHGERLAAIEAELPYIRKSLDGIEKGVEKMALAIEESTQNTQKMIGDIIHTHQAKQELQVERIDKRIDTTNVEVKGLDKRLQVLESDKKAISWITKILYIIFGGAVVAAINKWI